MDVPDTLKTSKDDRQKGFLLVERIASSPLNEDIFIEFLMVYDNKDDEEGDLIRDGLEISYKHGKAREGCEGGLPIAELT
ncbi:hypothetical protein TNCV_3944871 [Trichonephila clavipes]|nr:hypothetical protein TNCV_3944871 [Trichonephila clavipes]